MKRTTLYSLITAASLLLAGTAYGASNETRTGLIDVRPEGQNIFSYDNVGVSLKSHDMRNTTSSYGISPKWSASKDEQVWMDVRQEGQNIFSNENVDVSLKINNQRDTTFSYGIAPTWSDPKVEQAWYDLNILGR
jgi:hypothetical protein